MSVDLELNDFDLKPYMDPNILLDSFPDDMEMWNYNLFSDDTINSSIKDQIKEENTDIMDCYITSICPDDLITSEQLQLQQQQQQQQQHQQHHQFQHQINYNNQHSIISATNHLDCIQQNAVNNNSEDYYSSSCASSSPSSSSLSADASPNNIYHQETHDNHHKHLNCINLDPINFVPCMLNQATNYEFQQNTSAVNSNHRNVDEYYQQTLFDQICNSNSSSSNSETSASSSASTQDIYALNSGYLMNDQKLTGLYQFQKMNQGIKILPNCPSNLIISAGSLSREKTEAVSSAAATTPIIIVESSTVLTDTSTSTSTPTPTRTETAPQNKAIKHQLSSSSSTRVTKKAQLLPPSPPSSFGSSDSESNQSSVVIPTSSKLKSSKAGKHSVKASLNKLNPSNSKSNSPSSLKTRTQSYAAVKASHKHSLKSNKSSLNGNSSHQNNNSNNNNSNYNSDDDCWPFLCSLSKLPSSGPILLTEEEKRTLVQEGHQVPSQLPLSKGEEKILKKIRRKIKNKISAQESRRKKKEYVDSLEKRMENYINQNVELKRRLEDLELNNKNLLAQLQKMQTSLQTPNTTVSTTVTSNHHQQLHSVSANSITDFNDDDLNFFVQQPNSNSTNQFGTLLMVLVLFFAVVLGVWSPVFTKDQIAHSAAAAAATSSVNSRGPISHVIATTTSAVAVAAAVAVAGQNVATVKTESVSPTPSPMPGGGESPDSVEADLATTRSGSHDHQQSIRPLSPYATPNMKSRVLLSTTDQDDQDFIENNCDATSISTTSLIARSKTGSAVELTKVRPFIRKLPESLASTKPEGSQSPEYVLLNNNNSNSNTSSSGEEAGQIIVLNLSNNQNSIASLMSKPTEHSSETPKLNINLVGNTTVNSANYRVINTTSMNKLQPVGGGKIMPTTRFRLINNNSIATVVNTYSNMNQRSANIPSIIKLSSS